MSKGMKMIRSLVVGIWVAIAAILTACGGSSTADATNLKEKIITAHFVFLRPVADGLEDEALFIVEILQDRIEEETGIRISVDTVRIINQPVECDGVDFANVEFRSRVVQLRCLKQYAVRAITNKTDEWVHFFTPPFIVSDGTRRFAGIASGVPALGTCATIDRAIKCQPVSITNLALWNSQGESRLGHILEATEHEFGHIMGVEHREEFVCKDISYTMHPAALAYCSPNAYQCVENNRQSCNLFHHPDDVGRMLAQFGFIKRDLRAHKVKCRKAFTKRKCVRACRQRIRFYRPQLERLPKLRSCERQPTRGFKMKSKVHDLRR